MANLRDLVYVIRHAGAWAVLKRLYEEINDDNVFTNAAAMAYAWMFAIFPFFIFLLTLTPYLPDNFRVGALKMLETVLRESLTGSAADTILNNIRSVLNQPRGGLLSIGLFLTLYAASGGMNTTMTSLDQAFDVSKPRSYIVRRLVAIALTVFMSVCLLVIVLMLPVGTIMTQILTEYSQKLPLWVQDLISGPSLILLTVARYIIGLTVMQIMIGVLYHYGRSQRQRLRFFTPGSVFTAVTWIITGFVMRIYVENFANYSKTYGAVAGMVILLTIFYLNAVILLCGAELDSEIQHHRSELESHFRNDPGPSMPHA